MKSGVRFTLAVLVASVVLAPLLLACSDAPDVPFAPLGEGPPDFDAIEREFPLTAEHRWELTPENVSELSQPQLDQLYARLEAGLMPDGAYRGNSFFAEGADYEGFGEVLERLPPGLRQLKEEKLGFLGERLWKGKKFDRENLELRNIIQFETTLAAILGVDQDAIPREELFGRNSGLLFAATLSCGESLLDPRRESVIIDYANNDRMQGYIEPIDSLVGRDGLAIRDEIRLVRPGFYLGRAYVRGDFALNFTLYNEEIAEASPMPTTATTATTPDVAASGGACRTGV